MYLLHNMCTGGWLEWPCMECNPQKGPMQHEMRRDRTGSTAPWVYRVYLDNYDSLEKMDPNVALHIRGEVSAESLAIRAGYEYWGLPRHPRKSVQQELKAEIQGTLVDGTTGRVRPKPSKVMKYVELTWAVLGQCNPEADADYLRGTSLLCHVSQADVGHAEPGVDFHHGV